MEKIKYQLDYLSAVNERLCDSDRMYKMIALATGGLFIYRNLKRGICEYVGPWEKYLGYKPESGEFVESDLNEYIHPDDLNGFIDEVLCMEDRGVEYSELTLKDKDNNSFKCIGSIYYDSENKPTDKLIGFLRL
ncbi:MAG: PAS domain-containing protein [Lachnospiraceae bacterium]|nr:PAS domain-containing protein [Lachnospiraceae bacterium]